MQVCIIAVMCGKFKVGREKAVCSMGEILFLLFSSLYTQSSNLHCNIILIIVEEKQIFFFPFHLF